MPGMPRRLQPEFPAARHGEKSAPAGGDRRAGNERPILDCKTHLAKAVGQMLDAAHGIAPGAPRRIERIHVAARKIESAALANHGRDGRRGPIITARTDARKASRLTAAIARSRH